MTYIEQAIKEAVEKGGYHEGYHLAHFGDFGDELFAADKGARSIAVVVAEILLDPSFWQALGKARGWKEKCADCHKLSRSCRCEYPSFLDGEMYFWHRFIDHLAEGKDAESFFKTLV
jgi:hypothetical protein